MPDRHWIEELPQHAGQTASVCGWVTTTRSSGKIAFVVVRDGTGLLQAVLSKKDLPAEVWDALGKLTQETSIEVTGVVRAEPRAPGGVELQTSDLRILGPSPDFPITPKEHGIAFLFEHRHLWLRSKQQVAIARVRHEVIQAIRDFFYERHFTLVDTPILTGSIGEHAGTLFSVDYFDLGKAYLAQTGQLYVEAAAAALGKVYCFGPTFRARSRRRAAISPSSGWWSPRSPGTTPPPTCGCRRISSRISWVGVWNDGKMTLAELGRDLAPLERSCHRFIGFRTPTPWRS